MRSGCWPPRPIPLLADDYRLQLESPAYPKAPPVRERIMKKTGAGLAVESAGKFAILPRALTAIARGEDTTRQFKLDVHNADSLASEMVAFANSDGGTIFIGVADDGSLPGLSRTDVRRINQLIGNTASQSVRSPIAVQTRNVPLENDRVV